MKFTAGRYKGMEISEVALIDPEYLGHAYTGSKEEYEEVNRIFKAIEINKMKYKTNKYKNPDLEQFEKDYYGKYMVGKENYLFIRPIMYSIDQRVRHLNMLYNQRVGVISVLNWTNKNLLRQHTTPFIIQKSMGIFELEYYEFCSQEEFEINLHRILFLTERLTDIDEISKNHKK